jgi:peroxiredoxin
MGKLLVARTPSSMLELGTAAANFSLPDLQGNIVSLNDYQAEPLLVIFACNHCPYVLHILKELSIMMRLYKKKGLSTVMINANDVANYPEDSPEKMRELSARYQFSFPYLFDDSQQVAKAYKAACTPDFFLFDHSHKLFYRGQFDGSRPDNNIVVDGRDLAEAIEKMLQGQDSPEQQIPSLGCNIKWKAGNEPHY